MNDIFDEILGVDKKKEIFNLHYEINYLRILFNHVLKNNPTISSCVDIEAIDNARKQAQEIVKGMFPLCNIDFPNEDPEHQEISCNPPNP